MDSILFIHVTTPVIAPTMLDAPSGPNLDLLCVQQTGAALFCENYAKLYFDAKHLEKGLNRGDFEAFFQKRCLFFIKKMRILANIERYPKFLSRICPAMIFGG